MEEKKEQIALFFIQIPMRREFYQPIGELGEILSRYEAPGEAGSVIQRRAGLVIARGQLPPKKVEDLIVDSMSRSGMPDWGKITKDVGKVVKDTYHKEKRLWG